MEQGKTPGFKAHRSGSSQAAALFDLRDRVLIVTGVSSGIGVMLARGLVQSGARLAIMARRADRLEMVAHDLGDNVLAVPGDVAVEQDRVRVVHEALERFGRLDGLVNNAGTDNPSPALQESAADMQRLIEVNLTGPVELAKACVPALRKNGGSIVNITSIAAVRTLGTYIPQAAYVASKGGLAAVTRELAVQWGRYGIRVNAVAPGFFATDMTADLSADEGPIPRWFAERLPLRRPGNADDMLGIVRFLLSDASSYVTGQHIPVDGGFTLT